MVLLMETVVNGVSDIVSLGTWSLYPLMQDLKDPAASRERARLKTWRQPYFGLARWGSLYLFIFDFRFFAASLVHSVTLGNSFLLFSRTYRRQQQSFILKPIFFHSLIYSLSLFLSWLL
jgi:hypothetical protein